VAFLGIQGVFWGILVVFLGILGFSGVFLGKCMDPKKMHILLIIDLKGHYLAKRKFLLLVKTIRYD